jgi:hypothetical protein
VTIVRNNVREYLSSGEKYNPETDTWSPIPKMRKARASMATAVVDGKIFVTGGGRPLVYNNSVECFNDEEIEWFVFSRVQNIINS